MTVPSRTPEGFPSHCPLCGADVAIEFSEPAGDACCPSCGCLLWAAGQIKEALVKRQAELVRTIPGEVTPDTRIRDLGFDSLELVELVMVLEEEIDINLPDDAADTFYQIQTMGELIRWLAKWARPKGG